MPIVFKLDVLKTLKEAGYSTYKLRKEKIFGESVIQQFRDGEIRAISNETTSKLCALLNCQPGDLFAYVEGDINDSNETF